VAYFHSPRIVTDGLVLALDAGNIKSFRGEPTTNLLSQPTNISNWSKQQTTVDATPSFFREIDGNLIPFYKVTSTVITDPFIILTTAVGNISNRAFTYSVYLCTDPGQPTTSIQLFTYGNVPSFEGSSVTSATVTITSEPTRYKLTSTYGAGFNSTSLANRVDLNQATLGYLYVGGAQLEEKAYETRFVAGTRGTTVATGGGWADRSGNLNHGELVNGPTFSSANGGSITFDGINDYVNIGNPTSLNFGTGSFTVSLWFRRFSNVTTNLRLLAKGASGDTAGDAGFAFFGADTGISFAVNPTGARTIISAASYSVNEWVNVVGLVERGISMRTYKNGALTASTTAPGGSVTGTANLEIGRIPTTLYWPGNVSNVTLYNRALTAAEIQQNYNATKGRYGL